MNDDEVDDDNDMFVDDYTRRRRIFIFIQEVKLEIVISKAQLLYNNVRLAIPCGTYIIHG